MRKNRITYGAVVVLVAGFVVLRDYPMMYAAFYTVLILPLISGALARWQRPRLAAKAEFTQEFVMKGQPAELRVTVDNHSFLPCGSGQIALKSERFGLMINPIEKYFSMPGRSEGVVCFDVIGKHRGIYEVQTEIEFRDMLGLFAFKLPSPARGKLTIAPKIIPVLQPAMESAVQDTAASRKHIHGEDLTNFDQLREFQLTDSYRQIHWKASAKRGKFISKEFTDSDTLAAAVFMDNSFMGHSKAAIETEDLMVDYAISLTERFLHLGYRVGWQSTGSDPLRFTNDFVRLYELATHLPFDGTLPFSKVLQAYSRQRREPIMILVFAQSVSEELLLALHDLKSAGNAVTLFMMGSGHSKKLRELDIAIVDLMKGGGGHGVQQKAA